MSGLAMTSRFARHADVVDSEVDGRIASVEPCRTKSWTLLPPCTGGAGVKSVFCIQYDPSPGTEHICTVVIAVPVAVVMRD